MYLRKTTSRGHNYYQICETEGKSTKVLLHLGSLPSIIKKFQYIEELERTVSMLRSEIAQYVKAVNQVYEEASGTLKKDDTK